MGFEFLQRVRRTSIIAGLVLFPFIATYLGLDSGLAWVFGVAWSLVNLYFIGLLVKQVYADERKRLRLAALVAIKAPVLYIVGFWLLSSGHFPVPALLAGFMWPLFVIVLKALGRLVLRLDGTKQATLGKSLIRRRS